MTWLNVPACLPQTGNFFAYGRLNNTYRSQPRNKLIADFCKDMGLIEKYGSGIRRVPALFREAGLPDPQFWEMSGGFNVTVFAGVEKGVEIVTENVTENVADVTENRLTVMLGLMKEDPEMTIVRLVDILEVTRRTILRDLEKLKTAGCLRRVGSDKGGIGKWWTRRSDF